MQVLFLLDTHTHASTHGAYKISLLHGHNDRQRIYYELPLHASMAAAPTWSQVNHEQNAGALSDAASIVSVEALLGQGRVII